MDSPTNSTVTQADGYRLAETGSPSRNILASCAVLAIAMGVCLGLLVIAWAAMLVLPAQ